MSLNNISLIGRLTKDPELRYTKNDTPVANMRIAVDRPYSSRDETDFINIVVWNKTAENCNEYLSTGRLISVEGYLQIRNSEGENGRKYINPEVVARRVQFLDGNSDSNGNGGNTQQSSRQQSNRQQGNRQQSNSNAGNSSAPAADDEYSDIPF